MVNTWALILVDQSGKKHYLRVLGRWMEAATLEGPWAAAASPPATLDAAMQALVKTQRVDTLDDPGPGLKEAAGRGVLPVVHVSTTPAELIQTAGRPDYEPIDGTELLHVRELLDQHRPRSGRPASLRAHLGPVVPVEVLDRRPVGVRGARQAAGGVREDPRDPPARDRSRLSCRDAAVPGGAHRQQHPPDRRGQPDRRHLPGDLRGSAAVREHRGDAAQRRGELARAGDPGGPEDVLRARGRGVVHRRLAQRPLVGGDVGARGDLHDPAQFALCTT